MYIREPAEQEIYDIVHGLHHSSVTSILTKIGLNVFHSTYAFPLTFSLYSIFPEIIKEKFAYEFENSSQLCPVGNPDNSYVQPKKYIIHLSDLSSFLDLTYPRTSAICLTK